MSHERDHYNSMVVRYQNEVNDKKVLLEVKNESLKILQEVYSKLDYNPSKMIIQEDINSCESEIAGLKKDIRYAENHLITFQKIAEKLQEM